MRSASGAGFARVATCQRACGLRAANVGAGTAAAAGGSLTRPVLLVESRLEAGDEGLAGVGAAGGGSFAGTRPPGCLFEPPDPKNAVGASKGGGISGLGGTRAAAAAAAVVRTALPEAATVPDAAVWPAFGIAFGGGAKGVGAKGDDTLGADVAVREPDAEPEAPPSGTPVLSPLSMASFKASYSAPVRKRGWFLSCAEFGTQPLAS